MNSRDSNNDAPQNITKAILQLNEFSQFRAGSPQLLVKSLRDLCNSHVQLSFQVTGSHYCAFCSGWQDDTFTPLNCIHQTHRQCLQNVALQLSKNTLDPVQLEKMQCPKCKTKIPVAMTNRILGKEYIDKKMAEVAIQMAKQFEEKDKIQRKRQIEAMRFACPVCMEEFKIDDMITFSCPKESHRYCKGCATSAVQEIIKEGKFDENQLCCQQCKSPIEQQILKNILPPKDFERLMTLRHNNLKVEGLNIHPCMGFLMKKTNLPLMEAPKQFASQKERNSFQDQLERRCNAIRAGLKPKQVKGDVVGCPGQISYNPKEDTGFIECLVCGLETCIKGCESAHRGSTCERYAEWKKMVKLTDAEAENALRQAKMQRCPKCRMIVLKEVGCHHITCRCGEQFCYVCGARWAGHNRCPGA